MLFVHMFVGLVAGLLTSGLGLAWGAPPVTATAMLLLGCNLGLLASALAMQDGQRRNDPRRIRDARQCLRSRPS